MKHLIIVLILCLTLLSCASASFVVTKPCSVPDDFFGISPDRSPLIQEDFDILNDFNAIWIRSTIRWTGVEQLEGVWDFEYWDDYIEKAEAAGRKVILILGFDNRWLYDDFKEQRNLSERELPYFLNYVEQVVSRYGTRIIYEIWNEPNWVFWYGSDENFFRLSAAAAKKVKEVEPNATVLAGSTSRFDRKFTKGMFKAGAMENTDGFSVHPYGVSPSDTMRQVDKLRKLFNKYNYDKPIWVTEVGYSTGPISFCSIKRYPEYIVKTLSGLAARADSVRNMVWYEFMDTYNPGEVQRKLYFENYFGLIFPNRTLKRGADAFMLTAGNLAGTEYRPDLLSREKISKNITSLYFNKEDGSNTLIVWKNSIGKKKLHLTVQEAEEITNHNISNREKLTLSNKSVIKVGREPLIITWTGGSPPLLTKK